MRSSAADVKADLRVLRDGSTRGELTAHLDGAQVGHLRFATYGDVCQIEMVWVDAPHRRTGVARAMVADLRDRFPDVVPARFHLNGAGRALADALLPLYGKPESVPNDGKDGPGG